MPPTPHDWNIDPATNTPTDCKSCGGTLSSLQLSRISGCPGAHEHKANPNPVRAHLCIGCGKELKK